MDTDARQFLTRLLETPSPSGYERPVQDVIRDYTKRFADEVKTDFHGNVIAVRKPDAPFRVMLAGHCDQIGLIVQYIDDDGFVYFQSIGGWDVSVLIGQRVTIWSDSGPIPGVIGRKPIHLLSEEERKAVPKMKDLWIDIGAASKSEASQKVRIGDPITIELASRELWNNRLISSGLDDKSGAWVVIEALRRIDGSKLRSACYSVATVQEELGLRGARTSAFGIDPHVGVAVDVTFATDCPTMEKKEEGEIKLGKGPVIYRGPNMNPRVVERLIQVAEANNIPYQLAAAGKATGTDANAIQVNRAGVATGLISVPNRYMHSPVEMISLDDLDAAATLLARFVESISPEDDFIP
ncbi:M42 family metallopeptidase [Thermogutta sp.]|uniref:M42 family metallopeptidase n=1 Tax=Thermogutta sp. TaxID=1962930 RepID=UPI0032201C6F